MRAILIVCSLLVCGCAVLTGTTSDKPSSRQPVTVTSIDTDRYKSNYRIKLNFDNQFRARAEADKELVRIVFDRKVKLSDDAEQQLRALLTPCTYSKSYQKDSRAIVLRCPGNVKVYPEKGFDYFDLIISTGY